jgi:PhnB protein
MNAERTDADGARAKPILLLWRRTEQKHFDTGHGKTSAWPVCRNCGLSFVVRAGPQRHQAENSDMQPIPYLGFNGNCAEAMRFYEAALGGKIELMMSGADSPMAAQIPQEFAQRIVHARLALHGGGYLYGGDAPAQMPYKGIHGFGVTLNFDTVEEAQSVFDKLSAGGKVSMPMGPSFWARRFGMVTDRFGTPWIVNGGLLL